MGLQNLFGILQEFHCHLLLWIKEWPESWNLTKKCFWTIISRKILHWLYYQKRYQEFWGGNLIRLLSGISLPSASLKKSHQKSRWFLLCFTAFDIKSYALTIGTFHWKVPIVEAYGSGILQEFLIVIRSNIRLRIRDRRINVIFLWKLSFRNNFITFFSLPSTTYMAVDLSRALKLLKSISN